MKSRRARLGRNQGLEVLRSGICFSQGVISLGLSEGVASNERKENLGLNPTVFPILNSRAWNVITNEGKVFLQFSSLSCCRFSRNVAYFKGCGVPFQLSFV